MNLLDPVWFPIKAIDIIKAILKVLVGLECMNNSL